MARSRRALRAGLRALSRWTVRARSAGSGQGLEIPAEVSAGFDLVGFRRAGLRWMGRPTDFVTSELYTKGAYQGAEIAAVHSWLTAHRPSSVIVDVGANIGSTTVPLAAKGWRVLAVEPVPYAFELLQLNIMMNGLSESVIAVAEAVSASDAEVEMALDGDLGHSEVLRAGGTPGFGQRPTQLVRSPARRLEDIVAAADLEPSEIGLVWSDTQGHEADVIESGSPLWRSGAACFVEIWPRGLRSHGGLERLLSAAAEHFSHFTRREELLANPLEPSLRESGDLAAFIDELDALPPRRYGRFSDVLLLP